jgi:hypothetical protein
LRLLTRQFQQGADHAGVSTLALLQRAEDGVEDVRHLAQEGTGSARRLGGYEFQHHWQVIGQFAGCEVETSLVIGLRQVDHRRATIARIAMHVLEQVQGSGTTTVEQLHVDGLGVERIAARDRISTSSSARRPTVMARSVCSASRIADR